MYIYIFIYIYIYRSQESGVRSSGLSSALDSELVSRILNVSASKKSKIVVWEVDELVSRQVC